MRFISSISLGSFVSKYFLIMMSHIRLNCCLVIPISVVFHLDFCAVIYTRYIEERSRTGCPSPASCYDRTQRCDRHTRQFYEGVCLGARSSRRDSCILYSDSKSYYFSYDVIKMLFVALENLIYLLAVHLG